MKTRTLAYFMQWLIYKIFRKQPPRGVFKKIYSENMQQIYSRRPMPKCDFNKVALQLAIKFFLLHIFGALFLKNTSGWLLLIFLIYRRSTRCSNNLHDFSWMFEECLYQQKCIFLSSYDINSLISFEIIETFYQ